MVQARILPLHHLFSFDCAYYNRIITGPNSMVCYYLLCKQLYFNAFRCTFYKIVSK